MNEVLAWIGTIATPAAIVAAVYAVKAYKHQQSDSIAAEGRRRRETQPRPVFTSPRLNGNQCSTACLNTGGGAHPWICIWSLGGHIYGSRLNIQSNAAEFIAGRFFDPLPGLRGIDSQELKYYLSIAKDIDGRWWDCLCEQEISVPDLEQWTQQTMLKNGLPSDINIGVTGQVSR